MMTEWVDEATTRQGLYRFLGAALLPPEPHRLDLLVSSTEILDRRDLDKYPFSIAWKRFTRALGTQKPLRELSIEYVRLFGVGMTGTPASPTESTYRVSMADGSVADFMASLESEYRSMGLTSLGTGEAPDHVSTELEVMSYLCGVEAEAWESGQTAIAIDTIATELTFVRKHLASWLPAFVSRVRATRPIEFYGSACNLVHAFVVFEVDYLAGIVAGSRTA